MSTHTCRLEEVNVYWYKLADGGFIRFITTAKREEIQRLFLEFQASVRDAGYLDSHKFLPFLRKHGIETKEIYQLDNNTIYSYVHGLKRTRP